MKIDLSVDKYKAILFDFDGVLVECMNVKTEAFVQLFKIYGDDIVKKAVSYTHLRAHET